jgi:hypothetical protein
MDKLKHFYLVVIKSLFLNCGLGKSIRFIQSYQAVIYGPVIYYPPILSIKAKATMTGWLKLSMFWHK